MIKAVIFDVDGVLIDSFEANLKFYQDLSVKAGYKKPTREEYSKLFHATLTDVIKVLTKSKDEKEIKRIWEMGKNRVVRYPDELISVSKDLDKVLDSLKEKYTLAIVTSRLKGGIKKLPQLAKYESLFKTIIYYDDTQNHKPHPDPLLLAVKKLGIKPNEAVYIGDAETDLQASKAAGMKIIIYGKIKHKGADKHTDSFNQLPGLIKQLT